LKILWNIDEHCISADEQFLEESLGYDFFQDELKN
jgi:hypothetical protein